MIRGWSEIDSVMWASLAKAIILDNLTDNLAASSKSETGSIFIPEVAINTFASSTFVPYILQTHRRKISNKHNVIRQQIKVLIYLTVANQWSFDVFFVFTWKCLHFLAKFRRKNEPEFCKYELQFLVLM